MQKSWSEKIVRNFEFVRLSFFLDTKLLPEFASILATTCWRQSTAIRTSIYSRCTLCTPYGLVNHKKRIILFNGQIRISHFRFPWIHPPIWIWKIWGKLWTTTALNLWLFENLNEYNSSLNGNFYYLFNKRWPRSPAHIVENITWLIEKSNRADRETFHLYSSFFFFFALCSEISYSNSWSE